eukprot:1505006-Alexandrium_andersonii.AAC.1
MGKTYTAQAKERIRENGAAQSSAAKPKYTYSWQAELEKVVNGNATFDTRTPLGQYFSKYHRPSSDAQAAMAAKVQQLRAA